MLRQISIFTENTKGAMQKMTAILAAENINIYNVVTNDSAEYGIVRMLVDETDRAIDLLKGAGYMVSDAKVIAVTIPDDPGSLNRLLLTLTDANINIDYLYVSYNRGNAAPCAILKAAGYAEVEMCLSQHGYEVL